MAALILIVDDDPIQRRLLEAMTRRFGYESETAESGEQAIARLEAADKPSVNLIILDLVMPDLDGMGVLARMRQRDIAVPAIAQTAARRAGRPVAAAFSSASSPARCASADISISTSRSLASSPRAWWCMRPIGQRKAAANGLLLRRSRSGKKTGCGLRTPSIKCH